MNKKPEAHLVCHTPNPVEVVWILWEASRHNDTLLLGSEEEMEALFLQVLDSEIPIMENITFTFLLENIPISLREQMVRHRVGHHFGPRLGIDIVPELSSSNWWAQSMRVLDMGQFYTESRFRTPASVYKERTTDDIYERAMSHAQESYRKLINEGVSPEDAREVIPLGATHRLSWHLNLAALMHVVGHRACWMAQSETWGPLLASMMYEVTEKIHPLLHRISRPPCVNVQGVYTGCVMSVANVAHLEDPEALPPCPLWLHYHREDAKAQINKIHLLHPGAFDIDDGVPGQWITSPEIHTEMLRILHNKEPLWGRKFTKIAEDVVVSEISN